MRRWRSPRTTARLVLLTGAACIPRLGPPGTFARWALRVGGRKVTALVSSAESEVASMVSMARSIAVVAAARAIAIAATAKLVHAGRGRATRGGPASAAAVVARVALIVVTGTIRLHGFSRSKRRAQGSQQSRKQPLEEAA